jgi:hypothetical protein
MGIGPLRRRRPSWFARVCDNRAMIGPRPKRGFLVTSSLARLLIAAPEFKPPNVVSLSNKP